MMVSSDEKKRERKGKKGGRKERFLEIFDKERNEKNTTKKEKRKELWMEVFQEKVEP